MKLGRSKLSLSLSNRREALEGPGASGQAPPGSSLLDQATAREWFDYDPESGKLTWRKVRAGSNRRIGQEAGCLKKSKSGKTHRQVKIKGYGQPYVHRIIWCWVTGHFPQGEEEIDHKDGNGLNNKWSNLRLVSGKVEQGRNQRLYANNKTGVVGVCFNKRTGKYVARITVRGRRYSLGYFARIEAAIAAREAASKKFGFHPNHGQDRPL